MVFFRRMFLYQDESPARQALERAHGGLTAEQLRTEIDVRERSGELQDQVAHIARMLLETAETTRKEAGQTFLDPFNVQAIRNACEKR